MAHSKKLKIYIRKRNTIYLFLSRILIRTYLWYSILKDPTNPALFTNRALTRIKLSSWDACIDDCLKSIELEENNMKGYYYLAQAQLALHHPNEAFSSALTAYQECVKTNSSSTKNVSALVLQAKKEKWEAKERDRIRRRSALLEELEDGLGKVAEYELNMLTARVMKGEVRNDEAAEEKAEIIAASQRKIEELRTVFAIADPGNLQKRVCNAQLIISKQSLFVLTKSCRRRYLII